MSERGHAVQRYGVAFFFGEVIYAPEVGGTVLGWVPTANW